MGIKSLVITKGTKPNETNELFLMNALKNNGKKSEFYPQENPTLKELMGFAIMSGVGLSVDKDGTIGSQWTPEHLASQILISDPRGLGVDIRTVQLWFQDNEKGISPRSISLVAKVFGCGDWGAETRWRKELSAAQGRLVKQRRTSERCAIDVESLSADAKTSSQADFNGSQSGFAIKLEALFSDRDALVLPVFVLAGSVMLGFLAYIFGVHSITYSPVAGLDKQVGYFWAPNWTILEMLMLPTFLIILSEILFFWKNTGRENVLAGFDDSQGLPRWANKVSSLSHSFLFVVAVCFGLVFVAQWMGVYAVSLIGGSAGGFMIDWSLVAIHRPDVISHTTALVLSLFGMAYTAVISFLYLTGLIFIHAIADDFSMIANRPDKRKSDEVVVTGSKIMIATFRCSVFGMLIATCIKMQSAFLMSEGETILSWMFNDAVSVLRGDAHLGVRLDQRALASFTSFLLCFLTFVVFFISINKIRIILELDSSDFGLWLMVCVMGLLAVNFILMGAVVGFSILLLLSLLAATYSLIWTIFT